MGDGLVIDLLRPSGALHTIVVKPNTHGGRLVVADMADERPPHSADRTPVDIGSLRLVNPEGMEVSVFQSRPRGFARRGSSSVYDIHIAHSATPIRQGVYYLGFPPEWSVRSVKGRAPRRVEAHEALPLASDPCWHCYGSW